jgi:hypothetical protein
MAANGSAFIGCSAITVSMPLPGLRRLKCLNDWLLLRCMSPILARSVSAAPASLRLLSRGVIKRAADSNADTALWVPMTQLNSG